MSAAIERLLAYQIEARHTPGALVHVERGGKLLARAVRRPARAGQRRRRCTTTPCSAWLR
jgi:hypothetical protein